jgi:outer membrane protein
LGFFDLTQTGFTLVLMEIMSLMNCSGSNFCKGMDPSLQEKERSIMNKKNVLLAAALAALVGGQALAQESPWMVRLRAVQLSMSNDNGVTAAPGLGANDKVIPEVDVTYFMTKNLAAELILTVPQRQIVRDNAGDLGSFNHLPPTLTLQYHFTDMPGFKPYVGVGVNYTRISNVNLDSGLTLDSSSTGAAAQIGVDFPLDKKWSLNVDVKKVYIKTDVYTSAGVNLGTLKLDPTLFGVGLGYRF